MKSNRLSKLGVLSLGVAATALMASGAFAQSSPSTQSAATAGPPQTPADTAAPSSVEDIVVTGSLLRGVAPVGSQAITVSPEQITAIGATSTAQLLANLPQAGTFLTNPSVTGAGSTNQTVNRPTLRYLGNTSSGAASTLVLVDGHRLPGMGIKQTSPDVDAIAPGIIERVEIVTDGGSSTYGSDAVGGVINFITRKRFDGFKVEARHGFADEYHVTDTTATAGKTFGSLSTYLSYNFERHDAIYGRDRGYVKRRDYINNAPQDLLCNPGNVITSGVTYALPGLTAGLGNRCDISDARTFVPEQDRHSVFAGLVLDDGGAVRASLKGYFFSRKNASEGGPLTASVTLNRLTAFGTPNPYYLSTINGVPQTAAQTFQIELSPVLGVYSPQITKTTSYGFTPSFSADAGKGFQVNVFTNYGVGISRFRGPLVNPVVLPTGAALGTFDPSNLTSAASAAAIRTAGDYIDYGRSRDTLINTRAVVDGPIFDLNGRPVRIAVGGEYIYEKFAAKIIQGSAATVAATPPATVSRTIAAVFGEVNVPLLGQTSGIYELSVTASGRYDDYSDVGGTFNPKIGVNFLPVSWLTFRGNWSKSFQAPSLADAPAVAPSFFINLGSVRFPKPGVTPAAGQTQVFLSGAAPDLRPQKAKSYSFGTDVRVPFAPGLTVGATYYHIAFKDQIAITPVFDPAAYTLFPDLVIQAPTPAQLAAFAAQGNNPAVLTTVPAANLYSIADSRRRNLSAVYTSGLDFYLNYRHRTDFGSIYGNFGGNYILKFTTQASANAPKAARENFDTRLRLSGTIGAEVGNLQGEVTWNHSGGFDVVPTALNLNQSKVGDYDLFNLFFRYTFKGSTGLMKDFSVTLNVDNLFDKDPPYYNGTLNSTVTTEGYANGFTFGRLIRFGVSKKF